MRALSDETLLNVYRKRRGFKLEALAEALGCATSTAGRYCLPPGHAKHSRPDRARGEKLREWSGGLVHAGNYADRWSEDLDALLTAAGLPDRPLPAEAAPAPVAEGAAS